MKILFNFLDWNHNKERKKLNEYGAVSYYRLINIAKNIVGHEVTIMGKEALHFGDATHNWDKVFQEYDVLWLSSVYGEMNISAIFYWAQFHKKKVIMDIDDNFLDLPESNEMYSKFAPGKKERALFSASLSLADVIVTSTEPLKARLQKHFKEVHGIDKKIVVIPNMNQASDWDYPVKKRDDGKIIIGYAGSNSHQDDLMMVMPALAKILNKYPNVYLEMMGSVPKEKVKDYFGKVGFTDDSLMKISLTPATLMWKTYPEHLAKQGYDIGIAPLVDSNFTRSKSHIKFMEYAMYEIPIVASRVYPYYMEIDGREIITDGETGFLCKNLDEWEDKLSRLIESKELREKIGKKAKEHVLDNWQYSTGRIMKKVNEVLSAN